MRADRRFHVKTYDLIHPPSIRSVCEDIYLTHNYLIRILLRHLHYEKKCDPSRDAWQM